jgi:transcriptional regulator with XRE-family HTH domain
MTAEQFKQKRKALNLTQQRLAELLQVNRVTIAKWETGALPIDERTRLALEYLVLQKNARRRPAI